LRAPFALCRTKSTTAAKSSAMSPTLRFAIIRPLLIARLQTLRQLKQVIAPIARVSRHIEENRATSVTRFECIWRDSHTHPAITARPPLTRIAQGFQRAGVERAFFAYALNAATCSRKRQPRFTAGIWATRYMS